MDFGTNLVLVTGATGWLGTSLVEALHQGLAECDLLRRPAPELTIRCLVPPGQDASALKMLSARIHVVVGDVRSADDRVRFCRDAAGAVLFHTAGVIHPRRVADFYEINERGTAGLLDAAIAAGVRRAVVVSSNSPCGFNPHPDHLFDEDSPYHPYMNYGRSKMRMELAVKVRSERGVIETVVVRPPWFYGPNQPPRQTEFFRMIRAGRAPLMGGDQLRSMVYIDNLCQGILLAAATEAARGRTYWIADERPYAMAEIIATVERVLMHEFGYPCKGGRLTLPKAIGRVAEAADGVLQAVGLYHPKVHVLSEMGRPIACSIARVSANSATAQPSTLKKECAEASAGCSIAGPRFNRLDRGGFPL